MEIKFKDHSADMVRTVDRTGLMMHSFKESALRTKDDLEDIFGQNENSNEYASDTAVTGIADITRYAARGGDDFIHQITDRDGTSTPFTEEYIQRFQFNPERSKAIADKYNLRADVGRMMRNSDADVIVIDPDQLESSGSKGKISRSPELIHHRRREYAMSRIRSGERGGLARILPGSGSAKGNSKTIADRAGRVLRQIMEDAKAVLTSYTAAGAIAIVIVVVTIFCGAGFTMIGDENGDNFAVDLYEIGPGDTAIVKVAQAQLGNVGGDKYWKWYGFKSHVHWCAIWVSWCGNQCGYLKAGILPRFAVVGSGASWFKERHRWASGGYSPKPGDVIFFDWDRDGVLDHVGLVESCDGKTVTTIEGNSGNACRRQTYRRGAASIAGYGIPAYPGNTSNQSKDKGGTTKETQ